MLIDAAPEACLAACESMGVSATDVDGLLPTMRGLKGTIGTALAREFLRRPRTETLVVPDPLRPPLSLLGRTDRTASIETRFLRVS